MHLEWVTTHDPDQVRTYLADLVRNATYSLERNDDLDEALQSTLFDLETARQRVETARENLHAGRPWQVLRNSE